MLTANIDSMNAAARDSVPAFDPVDDMQDVPLDAANDLAEAFDGAHWPLSKGLRTMWAALEGPAERRGPACSC